MPDLLNGTEIDRVGGYFGGGFDAFAKHNGDSFADWDDKIMFQPMFSKLKLEENGLQRDDGKFCSIFKHFTLLIPLRFIFCFVFNCGVEMYEK